MNTLFLHNHIGFFWSIETALIGLGIGLVIAAIIMFAIRAKLKSVRFQRTACNYVRQGSFRLTKQSDRFLYRNLIRTPRQTANTGGRRR